MKNIIYLHQYFVPPDGPGGTRSYEMAKRLVNFGFEVDLITSSAYFPTHYGINKSIEYREIDGIKLHIIKSDYSNKLSYFSRMTRFFDFAWQSSLLAVKLNKPDVIFATSTPLTIAIPAIVAKMYHSRPMVFEVRDLWPEVPISMGALRNPILRSAARLLERVAYHSAKHIVALSPGMKAGVVKVGIDPNRVTVIPNSSDIQNFQRIESEDHPLINEIRSLNFKHLIVYTGTIGKANEVEYVVKLAAAVREHTRSIGFVIIGDGSEKEKVEAAARALTVLGDNLFMYPPIKKSLMPALYRLSTFNIATFKDIPELRHNSANKFFDSLAAGRPIIINYTGWQADLLAESGAGAAISPNDFEEAARQVVALFQNTESIKHMEKNALDLAHKEFNRDDLAKRLHGILEVAANR